MRGQGPKRRFSLFVAAFLLSAPVFPCTTFVLRRADGLFFGRNLDWVTGTGLVMTNPRNLRKTALAGPSAKPAEWVSKYGSVTFNQVGRELPYGGINEAGLVVEHMTLDRTEYPDPDDRPAIGACQWIQYQLDNYATVEEVLRHGDRLRIEDNSSRFHFLVCDRDGNAATVEFLDGKMVCHAGKDLPVEALANSTYDESLEAFRRDPDLPADPSLSHFFTAAQMTVSAVDPAAPEPSVDYGFRILQAVSQGVGTKWSIVYDLTRMRIHVKVFETPVIVGEQKIFTKTPGVSKTKVIDAAGFDFDCSVPPQVLDLECDAEGSVNSLFTDYTTAINREFIVKAFTFFKDWGIPIALTDDEMTGLAGYPDSFECAGEKQE